MRYVEQGAEECSSRHTAADVSDAGGANQLRFRRSSLWDTSFHGEPSPRAPGILENTAAQQARRAKDTDQGIGDSLLLRSSSWMSTS
eukprot:scaffold62415_cov21-Tisochrysis_lutea.AAC.1